MSFMTYKEGHGSRGEGSAEQNVNVIVLWVKLINFVNIVENKLTF